MNKAQGRRHSRKANYYKGLFDKYARKKTLKAIDREKRIRANKDVSIKEHPSDERRRAKRAAKFGNKTILPASVQTESPAGIVPTLATGSNSERLSEARESASESSDRGRTMKSQLSISRGGRNTLSGGLNARTGASMLSEDYSSVQISFNNQQ